MAARSSAVLRAEATTQLGALELDVALEVGAGECLALAGPSGAGKTSVLRVGAGLLRPERGLVEANGETWLDTSRGVDLPPERRSCGYLFQEYALFPHLSAWQNVAYPLRGRDRRDRALELLERFGMADLREADAPALLVTHDFSDAALLGDRVGVIDAGRVVQEGTPTELAAAPRSAFVADFTGAVVQIGRAHV